MDHYDDPPQVRRLPYASLLQERIFTLRRLNDTQALTSCFPPEVLSLIFQNVCPPIDFSTAYEDFVACDHNDFPNHVQPDYQHSLAAVSYLWRQVVISTPQLWTTVARRVDENSIQSLTSLLDLHFENVRNLPISIELDFCALWRRPDSNSWYHEREHERLLLLLEPLKAAVFDARRKPMIRHLTLICPPIEWLSFFNKNLSQCDSVALFRPVSRFNGAPYRPHLDLTELPCLKHVELIDHCHQFSIPESVTSLRLRKAGLTSIQSLLKFTNLVDLRMIRVYGPSSQTPIIFPQLEHFGCGTALSDSGLIRQIQLPSLRSLHWYIDHPTLSFGLPSGVQPPPRQALRLSFFSNLPRSLSSLTFVSLQHCRDFRICDYLSCVPQVSELNFINLHQPELERTIQGIGRRLSTAYSGWSPDVKVLPNLRKLSLTAHSYDWAYEAISNLVPLVFVEMLEALHRGGGSQSDFRLIFDDIRDDFHDLLVRRRLRALVKDGFDVDIALGSNTLDFSDDTAG
jgi:hypothetical protein